MSEKFESTKHQKRARHIWIILVLAILLLCGCFEEVPTKDVSKPFLTSDYAIKDAIYSPNGKYIVFSSKLDKGEFFDIWMSDYSGENQKQITFDNYDQIQPSMSNHNRRIVFSGYNAYNNSWNLWEYIMDSKSLDQLTDDIFNQTYPIYSNNDSHIIFTSNEIDSNKTDMKKNIEPQRVWTLNLNDMTKQLVYDTKSYCYHPVLIKESNRIIFSRSKYKQPSPESLDPTRVNSILCILNFNGTLNRTVKISDYHISYSYPIDEENIIFSIYIDSFIFNHYGQSIGLYNFETKNMTILLADCDYIIDRLSYNSFDNSILFNCRQNETLFLRKISYDPLDVNDNGFADNIEEEKEDELLLPFEMICRTILIYSVLFLLLILIIIILILIKIRSWIKKQKSNSTNVKFIEEK
jgi:hypothetical protein